MREHKHGGDIYSSTYNIDFSANLNPLGMPECVKQAAFAGVEKSAAYPDVQCRRLRRALAEKEGVRPEQIICGNGAAELIFLSALAVRPKRALLVCPGFAEYEQALTAVGCEPDFYPLKKENGFLLQEDYLQRLQARPDMIFLCNPNNPTGVTIPPALLENILDVCQENGIRVVLDLCFVDFLEEREQADIVRRVESDRNLFLLKAFTKTYAMAGLRLGYGICGDTELLKQMRRLSQPWSVSTPAQEAGLAALAQEEYVERARRLIAGQRRQMSAYLQKLGFRVYDSKANFLFFEGRAGLADACQKRGILIRDCANYRGLESGEADGDGGSFYRVAVRTEAENRELLRVLAEICDRQTARTTEDGI